MADKARLDDMGRANLAWKKITWYIRAATWLIGALEQELDSNTAVVPEDHIKLGDTLGKRWLSVMIRLRGRL